MSLPVCIDILKKELQKQKITNRLEAQFIQELIKDFTNIMQEDDYLNLHNCITKIEEFSNNSQNKKYLRVIQQELNIIEKRRLEKKPNFSSVDNKYRQYKIANIFQCNDFRLGSSKGECLGFTYSMVYPDSPFRQINITNEIPSVKFTSTVYEHQKNQLLRIKDQGIIKNIRHTGLCYAYDFKQQAKEIYLLAKKHCDKDFYLKRSKNNGGHANYISVRTNGDIWFMEPNCGAYVFTHEQQFIDFFQHISLKYSKKNNFYFFYELRELRYDPDNQLKESRTWLGMVRSLLTGSKYNQKINVISTNLPVGFAAGASAALAGAVLGTLIGSIVPTIGHFAGFFLGTAIGFSLGFASSVIVFNDLNLKTRFRGVLAPLNMIRSIIAEKRLKQQLSDLPKASPSSEKNTFAMLLSERNSEHDASNTTIYSNSLSETQQPLDNKALVHVASSDFWLNSKNCRDAKKSVPLDLEPINCNRKR